MIVRIVQFPFAVAALVFLGMAFLFFALGIGVAAVAGLLDD